MHFNEYLKTCREESSLTQEKLVEELYQFNIDLFEGLDTNALSKWERGVTKPRLNKQIQILKYFQEQTGIALPCHEKYTVHEAEEIICQAGIQNLLGKSKELVLNFPSNMIVAEDLKVVQLRNTDMLDKVLDINVDLDKDFNRNLTELNSEHFKMWALHPDNTFYVCEYKEQFFGLLFTLRLKPEVFEKIINFEMLEKELTGDDFASYDEPGTSYILSFFAMNEMAASMLFLRYYAYLIAHQDVITDVGLATMMEDAKKLIKNMNLYHANSKIMGEDFEMQTYRETLANFLASEAVIKMILSEQDCPEE